MRDALALADKRLDELESETRLQGAVNDIRKLAKSGPLTDAVIGEESRRYLLAPSSVSRRRLQYGNTVTALYAIWESYVEGLLSAYVRESLSNPASADAVVKNHLAKVLEVVNLASKSVPRYAGEDKAELLRAAAAVSDGQLEKASLTALIHHTYNLRSSGVQSLTSDLGASDVWRQTLGDSRLISTLTKLGLPVPVQTPPTDKLFVLDDLCQRRNDYAHGAEVDDLLDETYQLAYIKSVRATAHALFSSLIEKAYFPGSSRYSRLGSYTERFRGSIVVAVAQSDASCRVGDLCILVGATKVPALRTIASLRVDDVEHDSLTSLSEGAEVGIGFDREVAKSSEIFTRF